MKADEDEVVSKAKRGPKGPSKELSDQDFEKLLRMIKIQCTQTEICDVLGMSDTTLNRRLKERGYENFAECFKQNNSEGRISIRRMQWEAAETGNTQMMMLLGKHYLGQNDRVQLEHSGSGGGPIIQRIERVIVDPSSSDA